MDTPTSPGWTFLTHHAQVLLCIADDPDSRIRDLAPRVGITERAVQRIIDDLDEAGYLSRTRVGRRTHYQVHPELPFRHPNQRQQQVGLLLTLLGGLTNRPS